MKGNYSSSSKSPPHDNVMSSLQDSPWFCSNFDSSSLRPLGKGGSGFVFSAQSKNKNKASAIKVLNLSPQDDMKIMLKEVSILSVLEGCPNILKMEDIYMDSTKRQLIFSMELADGSLLDFIKLKNGSLNPTLIFQISLDCIEALLYAQKENFAHMDIKPANILYFLGVNRNKYEALQSDIVERSHQQVLFKISDWGAGLEWANKTRKITSYFITPGYCAPELELMDEDENQAINPSKADMFSFGLTILNCCGVPIKKLKHLNVSQNENRFNKDLEEILDSLDRQYSKIKVILKAMLTYDAKKRITLQNLKELIILIHQQVFTCLYICIYNYEN